LLYYRTSVSCVALAEALETVSHDRLTRLLQADWSGQTLLELAARTLFVWERGYLIIDDTVLPKPFATVIEGLAWVFSSQERKPVYGLSVVLVVWTNGTLRIPRGMRLWHKGGPSKYALALELLGYARNRLRCRPAYVLFDAWYPSRALLKRIRDYGRYFACRLKKNRRFNGQAVRHHRRHPYWAEIGWLSGGLKVLVVRHGKQYYATNRLTLSAVEVRQLYRMRPNRGIDPCLSGSTRPHRLSGALGAGSSASQHLLSGRVLCPGAGTAGSSVEHLQTQATAQLQGTILCSPSSGTVKERCVTSAIH
jgi:DDE superfamily endonuclease